MATIRLLVILEGGDAHIVTEDSQDVEFRIVNYDADDGNPRVHVPQCGQDPAFEVATLSEVRHAETHPCWVQTIWGQCYSCDSPNCPVIGPLPPLAQ